MVEVFVSMGQENITVYSAVLKNYVFMKYVNTDVLVVKVRVYVYMM